MNLIPDSMRAEFDQPFADLEDTFGRDIVVVRTIKTPKPISGDDDYDFTQPTKTDSELFDYSYSEETVRARIKYIEKQDKEFSMITTLGGEQFNLSQEFGILRIKVSAANSPVVEESTSLVVDGFNCKVIFRDRPHGLTEANYRTFYLQRVP